MTHESPLYLLGRLYLLKNASFAQCRSRAYDLLRESTRTVQHLSSCQITREQLPSVAHFQRVTGLGLSYEWKRQDAGPDCAQISTAS